MGKRPRIVSVWLVGVLILIKYGVCALLVEVRTRYDSKRHLYDRFAFRHDNLKSNQESYTAFRYE